MWIADHWKDYAVLDCGGGEKIERWGNQILQRPDPQAIWPRDKDCKVWNKPNAIYHRSNAGGGKWEIRKLPEQWAIHYGDLTFQLKPMSFKHTGLFPEQAANWDFIDKNDPSRRPPDQRAQSVRLHRRCNARGGKRRRVRLPC